MKQRARLDESWVTVMTAMIGETFLNNEEVCGAVVSIRKVRTLWRIAFSVYRYTYSGFPIQSIPSGEPHLPKDVDDAFDFMNSFIMCPY